MSIPLRQRFIPGVEAAQRHDDQRSRSAVADNLFDRAFTAERPNQRWVGDTIEFVIGENGTLYLAAILDLHGLDKRCR